MTPQQRAMFEQGLIAGTIEYVSNAKGENAGYRWKCVCRNYHFERRLRQDNPEKMKTADYACTTPKEAIELRVLHAMRKARMQGCQHGKGRENES